MLAARARGRGGQNITYSVSSIFATCDSIQMDGLEEMYLSRLANEPYIPLVFKSYYSYTLTNQTHRPVPAPVATPYR